MKTRYKILLVITTSAITYILFHNVLFNICMVVIDDVEICKVLWLFDTSIRISNYDWNVGDGIGSWSGTAEGMETPSVYESLRMNSGFIFWHMVLPVLVILLICQRDRPKIQG